MTVNDLLKSNFLENVTTFSITDTILAIVVSFLIGIYIFMVYKKTFSGVLYSRNFNISLIAMTMATTLIIMGVTSNVVLSLGMVGALSIVRFRTAIKDPMDTFYLYWSVATGILCGAGQIPLALIGSAVIGIVLLVVVNRISMENPYLLIVTCEKENAEDAIEKILKNNIQKYNIKTKILSNNHLEITYEIQVKKNSFDFMKLVSNLDMVQSASLLAYDGNFAA